MSLNLSEEEKTIFDGIKDFLKKNRAFTIEKIIPFLLSNIDRSLNFNSEKIEMILCSLIKKNVIFHGKHLTVDDILKNQNRKEIFNLIEKNPGVNFSEVKNTFGFGNNYADWHLKLLERFQFIRSRKVGNNKIFFSFNLDSKYDEVRFYLRNEKVKQIISLLENNKMALKVSEISKQLKIHHDTLKKYFSILEKLNFIDLQLDNDKSSYILNSNNYNTILKDIEL